MQFLPTVSTPWDDADCATHSFAVKLFFVKISCHVTGSASKTRNSLYFSAGKFAWEGGSLRDCLIPPLGLSILDDVREPARVRPLNAKRRYPNALLLLDNRDFHRADRRTISERLCQAWCFQWKDMALNKRRSLVVR